MARSAEEEVARDFLCFGAPQAVVVVCDASCLERNLNLVLQVLELTGRVVVCVNLMDEARKRGIALDLRLLSRRLGVPVVAATARDRQGLSPLMEAVEGLMEHPPAHPHCPRYSPPLEQAVGMLEPVVRPYSGALNSRWLALRLLDLGGEELGRLVGQMADSPLQSPQVTQARQRALEYLEGHGHSRQEVRDQVASRLVEEAGRICQGVVSKRAPAPDRVDRRLDRYFAGRRTAFPVMLLLVAALFWLSIVGANYPSQWLANGLFWVEGELSALLLCWGAPAWLEGALVQGAFRTLAWVVSVMLPPMAIFFPLFTLLEDAGYLPRMAFNLDRAFQWCGACGKQALTMCMGLGCNAAGVVGCRIIDSPRERLLAILTNSFVPCNGRLPPVCQRKLSMHAHKRRGSSCPSWPLYPNCEVFGSAYGRSSNKRNTSSKRAAFCSGSRGSDSICRSKAVAQRISDFCAAPAGLCTHCKTTRCT